MPDPGPIEDIGETCVDFNGNRIMSFVRDIASKFLNLHLCLKYLSADRQLQLILKRLQKGVCLKRFRNELII